MKLPQVIRIRIKALSLYLFCTILIYLAGAYFGGILLYLFYCLIVFLLLSITFFIIVIFGIKYYQNFSTDHPVKGETIQYNLKLSNESPVAISEVASFFARVNPLMTVMVPDFRFTIGARKSREFTYNITCTYRGIYQVGLKYLLISDISGFFTIRLPVWHRTFYVYPRIIKVKNLTYGNESLINRGSISTSGGLPDYTQLNSAREYKRNDPVRHIYWKKSAALGTPVLKEYDSSTSPGIALYMDVFNENAVNKSVEELEREDVSVEILTALVKFYLDRRTSVSVRCPCAPLFSFRGFSGEQFEEYYKLTHNIFFGPYASPVTLFNVDLHNGLVEAKSVILITHRLDSLVFNLLEQSLHTEIQVMVIFNHTGSSPAEKSSHRSFFNNLRDKGAVIAEVHSPGTIAGDLENQVYG